MENGLSKIILEYIQSRASTKLEAFDKKAKKRQKETEDPIALAELELELKEERRALEEQFEPRNWLTNATPRASQRPIVTHALAYTHPNAKGGSSVFCPGGPKQPETMTEGAVVSTASLEAPQIDSVGNAAAMDVTALLQLSDNGKALIDYIRDGDSTPLKPFAANDAQLKQWMDDFSKVFMPKKLSSHKLTKQLYFPVEEGAYHLLAPLYASSFGQSLYERIADSRFSEESKLVRKARRENKYHEAAVVFYPSIAVQSFGGTKPQNISQLNTRRGGKAFLLSCAPPTWGTQLRPPVGVSTVFSRNYFESRVGWEVGGLRRFLEQHLDKGSTVFVRRRREDMIDRIIDHFIQYGAEIQSLKEHAGWSSDAGCRLDPVQRLWLDPHRAATDEAFDLERQKNDWREELAKQFAGWLNRRIGFNKLMVGDSEHREWQSLVERKLRLLKEDLEVFA